MRHIPILTAVVAQAGGNIRYTPDWSLLPAGQSLAQQGMNFLAAIGLVAAAGFFIYGAILAAGGQASQVPHTVARGKIQMLVSALSALGIGVGWLVINAAYTAGNSAATG